MPLGFEHPPFPCLGSPARRPWYTCGRRGPRAERGKGAPRAPPRRPHTTHAAPCTESAAAAPVPEPPSAVPLRAEAEEHPYAPWPQHIPQPVRGLPTLPAHSASAAVGGPRPPVVYSGRWGRRTVRRAPPQEPSAPVRPNPDGACGAARYASPWFPPGVLRWESRPRAGVHSTSSGLPFLLSATPRTRPVLPVRPRVSVNGPEVIRPRNCASHPLCTISHKTPQIPANRFPFR